MSWRVLVATAYFLAAVAAARAESAAPSYPWRPLEAVERPAIPRVDEPTWSRNPIDAFIAAEHMQRGLTVVEEAPRHVLLRRVYLDLIGLPPTRDELHAFLADDARGAFERVVERLLESPQYGERWGRHWMDIWRYSDWAGWSDGGQIRDSQRHVWRWRDWIIESLNADKGYDRMVLEMLAADELSPTDEDALRATGYLVRNYKMLSRETWMQDVVKHTAQAFLGMTLDCARCHDHMYDAISQEEYYRVRSIFEPHNVRIDRLPGEPDTTKDGLARAYDAELDAPTYLFIRGDDRNPDKERPLTPAVPAAWGDVPFVVERVSLPPTAYYPGLRPEIQRETIASHEAQLAEAQAALDEARTGKSDDVVMLATKALRTAELRLASVKARIEADCAKYAEPPAANARDLALAAGAAERSAALAEAEEKVARAEQAVADTRESAEPAGGRDAEQDLQQESQQKIQEAEAKLAEATKRLEIAQAAANEPSETYTPLSDVYPAASTGRRLALARWIVDPRNPLTARVAANHLWQRHFGQAIVESTFDFGQNGRPPTHPALLDWLAAEFMQPTWRLDLGESGPRWIKGNDSAAAWSMKHMHRLIVTSRTYRTAGTPSALNAEVDPDNHYLWRMPSRRMEAELVRDGVLFVAGRLDQTMGGPELDQNQGLEVHRRSIYFRHAQEKQMPFLKTFDAAAVTECYERKESIVPQQALAMMNSELTITSGRALARKLNEECGDGDDEFVRAAYETVLSRPATEDEIAACVDYLSGQQALFEAEKDRVTETASDVGDLSRPAAEACVHARENLVQVLLNHHDFVTIR